MTRFDAAGRPKGAPLGRLLPSQNAGIGARHPATSRAINGLARISDVL